MKVKIDNKQKKYMPGHPISKLLNLIISNIQLLTVISAVDINVEMKKRAKESYKLEEIMSSCLEDAILSGITTEEVAKEFIQLWLNTKDEKLGILLEEIIAKCGPYKLKYKSFGYSRECNVYETNKENNFDVVFYEKEVANIVEMDKCIEITGLIEFHECKKNVCNVIPCNKDLLKDDFKKKLEFIKDVHNLVDEGSFFIPTFKYNTSGSEKFLKENGYEFIEILNIKKLVNRYC